jgi:hypothetical protein
MPGRWLSSPRRFLCTINGALELDTFFLSPLQPHHDIYIMDTVLQAGTFLDSEIRQINHCPMYLQAITLSVLCLSNGASLDCAMLQGEPSSHSSTTSWFQNNQAKPHTASWKLWRCLCAHWSSDVRLSSPLGPWLHPASKLRRQWPSYHDHQTGNLDVRTGSRFTRCVSMDPIRFTSHALNCAHFPVIHHGV